MPIEILMPALSPTMTEGNLAKWVKKEGDKIKPGDVIAEIETDKATMEVEAVDEGIIGKILVEEGTEAVKVNQLIAIVLEAGEDKSVLDNFKAKTSAAPKNEITEAIVEIKEEITISVKNEAANTGKVTAGERVFASPLAKRIAENEGINLANIPGSGPHGRIIKDDVLAAKSSGAARSNNIVTSGIFARNPEEYTKLPNNNMRKVIAKRLCESKQTVPHFYLTIDIEIDRLLQVRSEINNMAGPDNPNKLSVNDFVIKASAMALRKVPAANASWTDEAILKYNNVDISVAVAIDGGLITPIIRNADLKTISSISHEMKDLAQRARSGKLAPEEFQGGSFSISNLGMFGIKEFKAIINPPQSCIIAVGAGREIPIVKNGQITIANMMTISLSCDHRVVDGAVGAEFLSALKGYIENPVSMLA